MLLSPNKIKRDPASRDAFSPSTREATPELSIYRTSFKLRTTRGIRFTRSSRSNALRTSGELARSMSPDTSRMVVLSIRRTAICTVVSPSGTFRRSPGLNILYQAQLIGDVGPREFHDIHALPDIMQPQSAGPNFIQRTAAHFFGIGRRALVGEQDFEALFRFTVHNPLRTAASELDRLIALIAISMTNDIGHRFVNGTSDRPALRFGEAHFFRQPLHRAAHGAEQVGIAPQLELQ